MIGISAGAGAGFLAGRLAVIDRPAGQTDPGSATDLRPRMATLEARLAAVEQRPDVMEALIALDADVVALRDAVHRELTAADRRIDGLLERITLMEEALAAVGELAAGGSDLVLDEDDVRYWAAQALGEIGPAAAPALREALNDSQNDVRRIAAEALQQLAQ